MLVKCPKCRYQFDVPAWPGATQLQCNCARCGTPFTYTIENEGDNIPEAEKMPEEVAAPENDGAIASEEPAGTTQQATTPPVPPRTSSTVETTRPRYSSSSTSSISPGPMPPPLSAYARRPNDAPRPSYPPIAGRKSKKSSGCLRKMMVVGVVATIGIILLLLQCDAEKDYNQTVSSGQAPSSQQTVHGGEVQFDANAKQEKAPQWIQGRWHVDTDFGGISLTIRGQYIVETSGGQTCSGKYRYQNHRLFCDYGDGKPFVYRLDEEKQRIDAGNGLMMEKAEGD